VTLYWETAAWPQELGISLRPTQAGAMMPSSSADDDPQVVVQVDAPAPLHGLIEAGAGAVADSHRVPLPPGADGILLIVYTRDGDGFHNLVELPLEFAPGENWDARTAP
jgi:hypothetical protein